MAEWKEGSILNEKQIWTRIAFTSYEGEKINQKNFCRLRLSSMQNDNVCQWDKHNTVTWNFRFHN